MKPTLLKSATGPSIPNPGFAMTAVTVGTTIYLLGFGNVDTSTPSDERLRWMRFRLDENLAPVSTAWEPMPPLPSGRFNCQAVAVGEKIYLMGGGDVNWSINMMIPNNVIDVFDTTTNTWSQVSGNPISWPYPGRVTVNLGGGVAVAVGTAIHCITAAQHLIYETTTGQWSGPQPLPPEPLQQKAWLIDNCIYAVGDAVCIYDLASSTWSQLPLATTAPGVIFVPNGAMQNTTVAIGSNLLCFGYEWGNVLSGGLWAFDTTARAWYPLEGAVGSVMQATASTAAGAVFEFPAQGVALAFLMGGLDRNNLTPLEGFEMFGFVTSASSVQETTPTPAPAPSPPVKTGAQPSLKPAPLGVIFGTDSRIELKDVSVAARRDLGAAVAAMTPVDHLHLDATPITVAPLLTLNDFVEADEDVNPHQWPLSPSTRFRDQHAFAHGTVFLIAPDIVATAGHNVFSGGEAVDMADYRIVFGWQLDANGNEPTSFTPSQIYQASVLRFCFEDFNQEGYCDWALLKLDRPVTGVTPLTLSTTLPKINDPLWMIGYPMGLPAKYCDNAKVTDLQTWCFQQDLDGFSGNSGSPVFNASNEVVGIFGAGPTDFVADPTTNSVSVEVLPNASLEPCRATRVDTLRDMMLSVRNVELRCSFGDSFFDGTAYRIDGKLNGGENQLTCSPPYGRSRSYVFRYAAGASPSLRGVDVNGVTLEIETTTGGVLLPWIGWVLTKDDALIQHISLVLGQTVLGAWSNDTDLGNSHPTLSFNVDQQWLKP